MPGEAPRPLSTRAYIKHKGSKGQRIESAPKGSGLLGRGRTEPCEGRAESGSDRCDLGDGRGQRQSRLTLRSADGLAYALDGSVRAGRLQFQIEAIDHRLGRGLRRPS